MNTEEVVETKRICDLLLDVLRENVKNEEIDGDVLIQLLEILSGLTLINAQILNKIDISSKVLERYVPNE